MAEEKELQKKLDTEKPSTPSFEDEYTSFTFRKIEFSNALIGTYNQKHDYVVSQEILKELVAVNKVIRENYDNRYYAISTSSMGASYNIKFSVVISPAKTEGTKIATLSLLEDVVNPNTGSYSILSTPIASYKDDDDAYFFIKVKKVFNLYQPDESMGKEIMDDALVKLYIQQKTKKLAIQKRLDAFDSEVEEEYFKEMVKELKKMGGYGQWVLKNFMKLQQQMGSKFPAKNSPKFYRECARLLNLALENAKGYPITPAQLATIQRIQKSRMNALDNLMKDLEMGKPVAPKKAAQKASASKAASSSGAKKAGGAKAAKKDGKADKKADKKKKETIKYAGFSPKKNSSASSIEQIEIKPKKPVHQSKGKNSEGNNESKDMDQLVAGVFNNLENTLYNMLVGNLTERDTVFDNLENTLYNTLIGNLVNKDAVDNKVKNAAEVLSDQTGKNADSSQQEKSKKDIKDSDMSNDNHKNDVKDNLGTNRSNNDNGPEFGR